MSEWEVIARNMVRQIRPRELCASGEFFHESMLPDNPFHGRGSLAEKDREDYREGYFISSR